MLDWIGLLMEVFMPSVKKDSEYAIKGLKKPMPITISFDVKIGEKSYVSVYDRIMRRLAKELKKSSMPNYIFVKGELIVAFFDGRTEITKKMLNYVSQLRTDISEELGVELPGWGVSALSKHSRGNIIRVVFQCWLVYEHYIFPSNRWDD